MEVEPGEMGDLAQLFRTQRFAQIGLDMVEHFREASCVFFSLSVAHHFSLVRGAHYARDTLANPDCNCSMYRRIINGQEGVDTLNFHSFFLSAPSPMDIFPSQLPQAVSAGSSLTLMHLRRLCGLHRKYRTCSVAIRISAMHYSHSLYVGNGLGLRVHWKCWF